MKVKHENKRHAEMKAIRWTGQNLQAVTVQFPGVLFRQSRDWLVIENARCNLDKCLPGDVVFLDPDGPEWRDHRIPSILDAYQFKQLYPEATVG